MTGIPLCRASQLLPFTSWLEQQGIPSAALLSGRGLAIGAPPKIRMCGLRSCPCGGSATRCSARRGSRASGRAEERGGRDRRVRESAAWRGHVEERSRHLPVRRETPQLQRHVRVAPRGRFDLVRPERIFLESRAT